MLFNILSSVMIKTLLSSIFSIPIIFLSCLILHLPSNHQPSEKLFVHFLQFFSLIYNNTDLTAYSNISIK